MPPLPPAEAAASVFMYFAEFVAIKPPDESNVVASRKVIEKKYFPAGATTAAVELLKTLPYSPEAAALLLLVLDSPMVMLN
jgi:hypothetical protein